MDYISFRYLDTRKKLKVNKVTIGHYIYYPKNCDGEYGNETVIVDMNYLNKFELKETFIGLLNALINDLTIEKNNYENFDLKFDDKFLNELIKFKESYN